MEKLTINLHPLKWGVILAVLSTALVGGRAAFAEGPASIWLLPKDISAHGSSVDFLFYLVFYITGVVFVLVAGLLIYFLIRYRSREGRKVAYIHGHGPLEVIWTVIPAIILVVLLVLSQRTWATLRYPGSSPRDAVRIEVTGEQFAWNIRYPGADGQFGRLDLNLVATDNPLGLDPADPAGADDVITLNQLHIPVGKPIRVTLTSKDVIHSFFLPYVRIKQDAVPGMRTEVWFEVTQADQIEIACAELCGLGHYRMRGFVTVESPEEFEAWLQETKQGESE
jgi:cytochrome c oxidase subunit 2